MKNIFPKCLNDNHEMGHTSRGYILPCCWADRPDLFTGDMKDLVQKKFKLNNVQSISEIIESNEWQNFYNDLKNGLGRKICHIYCSDNPIKVVTINPK